MPWHNHTGEQPACCLVQVAGTEEHFHQIDLVIVVTAGLKVYSEANADANAVFGECLKCQC